MAKGRQVTFGDRHRGERSLRDASDDSTHTVGLKPTAIHDRSLRDDPASESDFAKTLNAPKFNATSRLPACSEYPMGWL